MELREVELSIKFPDVVKALQLLFIALRDFEWTKEELKKFLLLRAEKLFDLPSSQIDNDVRTSQNSVVMRNLKNIQYDKKRHWLNRLFRAASKRKNHPIIQGRKRVMTGVLGWDKNTYRKRE